MSVRFSRFSCFLARECTIPSGHLFTSVDLFGQVAVLVTILISPRLIKCRKRVMKLDEMKNILSAHTRALENSYTTDRGNILKFIAKYIALRLLELKL